VMDLKEAVCVKLWTGLICLRTGNQWDLFNTAINLWFYKMQGIS
jgi:hypothetical protein